MYYTQRRTSPLLLAALCAVLAACGGQAAEQEPAKKPAPASTKETAQEAVKEPAKAPASEDAAQTADTKPAAAQPAAATGTHECDDYFKAVCPDIKKMLDAEPNLGVSIAVSQKDGKLAYATFNGTPEGKPIEHGMPFEVGSITKTFTAARIMQLIKEKKGGLTLDTPLSKALGANDPNLPGKVTIKQLLNFTAGLEDFVLKYGAIAGDLSAFWPMKAMTDGKFFNPNTKPGAPCYTSTNALMLGLVMDKLNGGNGTTKEPLVSSYREGLFKPAGLENTYLGGYEAQKPISSCTNINFVPGSAGNPGTPPELCSGSDVLRRFTGDGNARNDSQTAYLSFAGPGGGIISTSGDTARWFRWLFTAGPGREMVKDPVLIGERKLNDEKRIQWYKCGAANAPWSFNDPKLVKMQMGYHVEINELQLPEKRVKFYSFLGGTLSFNGYVLYLPDYDLSFAVLTNNFNVPSAASKLNSTDKAFDISHRLIDYVVTGK